MYLLNVHITREVCRADQFGREINLCVNSTDEVMLFAFTCMPILVCNHKMVPLTYTK